MRTRALGLFFAGILAACALLILLTTLCDPSGTPEPSEALVAHPVVAGANDVQTTRASQEPQMQEGPPPSQEEASIPQRRFISEKGIGAAKQVDALPGGLGPEIVKELRSILNDSSEGEVLRNNVANKLRRCGEEHLVADLTEMAWDERETPKWRNYCVQHLYTCYEEDGDAGILGTLFRAADPAETDEKMVRICAVWSLARAATPRHGGKALDEPTLGRIRTVALDALREKDAHFLVTTAGVQSCAHLGLKEALPDIRALASDDATKPVHLRVVSVAALGDLGDESDLALLDRLAASATGQLKSAAAHAAKKVRARAAGAGDDDGERNEKAPESVLPKANGEKPGL